MTWYPTNEPIFPTIQHIRIHYPSVPMQQPIRMAKQVDPFYISKEWLGLKAKVKARWKRMGWPCGYCGKPIDWKARPIADHKQDRKAHPELALEESNIQIVHHACNTRKGKWYDNSKRTEIGIDGYPKEKI